MSACTLLANKGIDRDVFCAQCCGNEKVVDWRPHLAVMLSNETGDPAIHQKAIITMGDTLGTDNTVCLTACNAVSAQT